MLITLIETRRGPLGEWEECDGTFVDVGPTPANATTINVTGFSGLTDVEYTVTVTDTQTGTIRHMTQSALSAGRV